ncbi:MAG: ribosome maturation factor RimP [Thermodesulfobacteriota bacterium]|nr:ribosome maturation factor RimP [Thermodesulfobacteriota bacterium]
MDHSSRSYREKIIELVEPVVESRQVGMELVDVECLRGKTRWMVRIYIDKEGGVSLDDCAMISGEVGDLLDVNETPPGSYSLEISSPGLDRPLARDKDFIRYTGHKVRIRVTEKIEGKKNFRGRLVEFIEKEGEKIVVINVEGKVYNIPRSMIVKTNLQYEF